MTEIINGHKTCKECQYNSYPICTGTIMKNKSNMNIENLKPNFKCGQKDQIEITDFSIFKTQDEEITELKSRIEVLEGN